MIAADRDLEYLLRSKSLEVRGMTPSQMQPASIYLRLGDTFLVPILEVNQDAIRMDRKPKYIRRITDGRTMLIKPHEFMLATTQEYIKIPNGYTAFVEGRSSVGRMGLFIQNAGWVDPGFEGQITLELFNATMFPILLQPGRRIAQLVIARTESKSLHPYNGKYQRQRGATGSMIDEDKEV